MAATIKPVDAFTYAKDFLKQMNLEKVGPRALDNISKIMWMAAPWRWTVGSMPTTTLTSNTQDYTISVPADFLYLISPAYLSDGVTAPRELKVEPSLPATVSLVGQPNRVAVVGSAYRVSPKPGNLGSPAPSLIAMYKKTAPTITATTMHTAGVQVFDDEWFWVFQEGVLWQAYLYGDDSRAGNAEVVKGEVRYTGQRAVFEAGLNFMRQNEPLLVPDSRQP